MKALTIILDAGHGGHDSGAVAHTGITEKSQTLAMVLTLKQVLTEAGHHVKLSRIADVYPDWHHRTDGQGRADLAVAVHMDEERGRALAYYPVGRDYSDGPDAMRSLKFAHLIGAQVKDSVNGRPFLVAPDTTSRFERLYIRDFHAPVSVLWELGPVRQLSREDRLELAGRFMAALSAAVSQGVVVPM